jgi:hypothetical protein
MVDWDGEAFDTYEEAAAKSGQKQNFLMTDGARWHTDKRRKKKIPRSFGQSFPAKDGMFCWSADDKKFYVVQKKQSYGQVKWASLSDKDREHFRKSRRAEQNSLLKETGALKMLTLEESRRFAQENPGRIIDSLWVDRWKPTETEPVPKSRWCAVGWQDPDVHEIEKSAPTPTTGGMYAAMQLMASRRWQGKTGDAKTAFLQSLRSNRSRPLAIRQPRGGSFEGYHPDQLMIPVTEVYGLVSGPAWWRKSLVTKLVTEHGYRLCPYDRCVLTLPGAKEGAPTRGVIVLEVDDTLEGGEAEHIEQMKLLKESIRFGKSTVLQEEVDGVMFAGRRIRQLPSFAFKVDMNDFCEKRLDKVKLKKRPRAKNKESTVLEKKTVEVKRAWALRTDLPEDVSWSQVR